MLYWAPVDNYFTLNDNIVKFALEDLEFIPYQSDARVLGKNYRNKVVFLQKKRGTVVSESGSECGTGGLYKPTFVDKGEVVQYDINGEFHSRLSLEIYHPMVTVPVRSYKGLK